MSLLLKNKTIVAVSLAAGVLAAAGLVCLMAYDYYGVTGLKRVTQVAGKQSAMFLEIYPGSRVALPARDASGELYRPITGDPVYVSMRLPRGYDSAEVEVSYKDAPDRFSIGLEQGEGVFDLKTIEYGPLQKILSDSNNWQVIQRGNVLFAQRLAAPKKYATAEEFIQQFSPSETAAYQYDLSRNFKIPGYQKPAVPTVIDRSMRGQHIFWTYIGNQPLSLEFDVQDINRREGEDLVEVLVTRNEELVASGYLADNGKAVLAGPVSKLAINTKSLQEGAYKISFNASEDIFIRKIRINSSFLVAQDRLYLTDNEEYSDALGGLRTDAGTVYSDAAYVSAFTSHYRGLQKITAYGQPITLDQTHQAVHLDLRAQGRPSLGYYEISLPKNDVKLEGHGFYAFKPGQYFNPTAGGLDWGDDKYNYVVARYAPTQEVLSRNNVGDHGADRNWLDANEIPVSHKTASASFSLASAKQAAGRVRFVISAPGASKANPLMLYEIRVTLKGRKLGFMDFWDKFSSKIWPKSTGK